MKYNASVCMCICFSACTVTLGELMGRLQNCKKKKKKNWHSHGELRAKSKGQRGLGQGYVNANEKHISQHEVLHGQLMA